MKHVYNVKGVWDTETEMERIVFLTDFFFFLQQGLIKFYALYWIVN